MLAAGNRPRAKNDLNCKRLGSPVPYDQSDEAQARRRDFEWKETLRANDREIDQEFGFNGRDPVLPATDRVVVLQVQSNGAGIDGLQGAASVVVLGELDWSPAVHDQVIGRLHRHGQEDPVVAYYLVSEEGSDPVIGSVLGLKRLQADGVRDPLGQDPAAAVGTRDHIRQLAEQFVAREASASTSPR